MSCISGPELKISRQEGFERLDLIESGLFPDLGMVAMPRPTTGEESGRP